MIESQVRIRNTSTSLTSENDDISSMIHEASTALSMNRRTDGFYKVQQAEINTTIPLVRDRFVSTESQGLSTNKSSSSRVANAFNNLGDAYIELGGEKNIRKALKYYEKSLKMHQELFPSNHLDVAMLLSNVGMAYEVLRRGREYTERIKI